MQPWLCLPPLRKPHGLAWIVQINDASLWFAESQSALVIPPESRIQSGTIVDRLYSTPSLLDEMDSLRGFRLKSLISRKAREWRCTKEDIQKAHQQIKKGYPLFGKEFPRNNSVELDTLLAEEYEAFVTPFPDVKEDEDFVPLHRTADWNRLHATLDGNVARIANVVDCLVEVRRLKEVMVFKGFKRVDSAVRGSVPPHICGSADWLPAIASRGEGIFFTLREDTLSEWEKELDDGYTNALKTYFGSDTWKGFRVDTITSPRFLLLHTLAHVMMRQIHLESGYPAASLKERIYCDDESMAGVLIYVTVANDAGTLGGLARLAEPRHLLRIMISALEQSAWCSFDPVCLERGLDDRGLLNRAVCHGCVFVPETSCILGNKILDRILLQRTLGVYINP